MSIVNYDFQVGGVTFSYKFWDEDMCHSHHGDEKMLRDTIWDVRDGMYCVDMGAGCGDYTLAAIRRGAERVYAFEPHPETFELLKRNVILNKWQDRCVLSNLGVSSSTRSAYLHKVTHNVVDDAGQYPINLTTLDDFIDRLSIAPPRLDWIKMDIEIEEIEAAKGMVRTVRRYAPKIIIEMHEPNSIRQFLSIIDANYSAESLAPYRSGSNLYWLCIKR